MRSESGLKVPEGQLAEAARHTHFFQSTVAMQVKKPCTLKTTWVEAKHERLATCQMRMLHVMLGLLPMEEHIETRLKTLKLTFSLAATLWMRRATDDMQPRTSFPAWCNWSTNCEKLGNSRM